MASFVYERRLIVGLSARVGTNLVFRLLMSNTTADTETEAEFTDDFTTLDECDGANYAEQDIANEAAATDLTNSRGELTADAFVYTSLGAGTRQNVGVLQELEVTTDADSPPDVYHEFSAFDGNGENVTFTPDAQGLMQAANA